MHNLLHWCRLCPVAAVSTLAFLGVVIAAIVSKPWRQGLASRLVTPLPSTHSYFGALDAYRGIAAVLVVFCHMFYFCIPVFNKFKDSFPTIISNGGNKAVPVFVVLSGFLIFRSVRKIASIADLREYAHRRFLRIYPLYLATVLIGMFVGQLALVQLNFADHPKRTLVLSELFMLRSLSYPQFVNPPAWSLYVEMCFYVFLPIFVVAAGRWVTWLSAILFAVLVYADPPGARELQLWKFFFAGILVSQAADLMLKWIKGRTWLLKEAVGLSLFFAGSVLLVKDFRGHDVFAELDIVPKTTYPYTVSLAVGFALILLGTFSSALLSKVMTFWPLRVLGTISYSIYLVHPFYILANFPKMVFSQVGQQQPSFESFGESPWWYGFAVFFPGLLLWSAITYILIERPFLLMGRDKPQVSGAEQESTKPLSLHKAA